jgi:arsenate reductase (thioredoxin)
MERQRVLFICTHNSARSQMAEGLLRHFAGGRFEVYSAGTEATEVRPEAINVMAEIGIDISGQTSKTLDRYLAQPFDWVITVCDRAKQTCPVFPGAERTAHWSFDDPSEASGTEEERLAVYRRVRQEIAQRAHQLLAVAERSDLPMPEKITLR